MAKLKPKTLAQILGIDPTEKQSQRAACVPTQTRALRSGGKLVFFRIPPAAVVTSADETLVWWALYLAAKRSGAARMRAVKTPNCLGYRFGGGAA